MLPEDFTRLYDKYKVRLINVAVNYVRHEDVAQDIVADSFMAFWDKRLKLGSESNIPGYLTTIVKNRCLNWLKQQTVHARVEKDIHSSQLRVLMSGIRSLESTDPGTLYDDEVSAIIRKQLDGMPRMTREIFIASRMEDMTHGEIARHFSIKPRTVNTELRKALAVFRVALKDYLLPVLFFIFY